MRQPRTTFLLGCIFPLLRVCDSRPRPGNPYDSPHGILVKNRVTSLSGVVRLKAEDRGGTVANKTTRPRFKFLHDVDVEEEARQDALSEDARKLAEEARRRNRTAAKAQRLAARRVKEELNKAAKAARGKAVKAAAATEMQKAAKAALDSARRKAKRDERMRRKREMIARERCGASPCKGWCAKVAERWDVKCTWEKTCCARRASHHAHARASGR